MEINGVSFRAIIVAYTMKIINHQKHIQLGSNIRLLPMYRTEAIQYNISKLPMNQDLIYNMHTGITFSSSDIFQNE